jgi:threonine aldolase
VKAGCKPDNHHHAPTRLVCVENTHNRAGGKIWPEATIQRVLEAARDAGLRTTSTARGCGTCRGDRPRERELAAGFDTVSVCLSKGLGAPVGLADLRHEGRRVARAPGAQDARRRHAPGGHPGGRRAVRARAPPRALVEDHANARRSRTSCARREPRDSNIVMIDLRERAPDAATFVAAPATRACW